MEGKRRKESPSFLRHPISPLRDSHQVINIDEPVIKRNRDTREADFRNEGNATDAGAVPPGSSGAEITSRDGSNLARNTTDVSGWNFNLILPT